MSRIEANKRNIGAFGLNKSDVLAMGITLAEIAVAATRGIRNFMVLVLGRAITL